MCRRRPSAVDELLRARVVCDEWEQASHNGEIAHAVGHGLTREDVSELGRVLTGEEEGRRDEHEITVFDSTGWRCRISRSRWRSTRPGGPTRRRIVSEE